MVCRQSPKIIYELASLAFCEYCGTQTRIEYDERPVDMPPMVFVSVGGTRPGFTVVWKHNSLPPFCKMATRTFKISGTYSAAPRPRRLFYNITHNTQVREHIHTRKGKSLAVRSMAFQVCKYARIWNSN